MTWRIEWTERSLKELERLDGRTRTHIMRALERLAATGYGDAKHLRGETAEWRLRVGAWRVRFEYDFEASTMVIYHVLPRGRAYRD